MDISSRNCQESVLTEPGKNEPSSGMSHGRKSWVLFWILLTATLWTAFLAGGFLFSLSLVFILGTHEFGHYWASRINRVKTSLPHFIPAPPVFIAGTFGAFIQINGSIPNRKALMEIGSAGPIAGFLVALPTLILGLNLSSVEQGGTVLGLSFGSSLIMEGLSRLVLGVSVSAKNINIVLHPVAFAGWIGMFITGLNLLPIGQLDGGHVIYALFKNQYRILCGFAFTALLLLGWFWNGWWFWAFIVAGIGFRHTPVIDHEAELDKRHLWMGYGSIFIFIVTFIPVPFELMYS